MKSKSKNPVEIVVPRLGWSMEEGAFVAWLKRDGEWVQAGEPLFSIEGDKAIQEVESIDSGILRVAPNGPKPGEKLRVGDVLGYLVPAGETAPAPASAAPAVAAPPSIERAPAIQESTRPIEPRPVPRRGMPSISPRALRAARERGVDWTQLTGSGRTGRIRERDVIAAADAAMRQ